MRVVQRGEVFLYVSFCAPLQKENKGYGSKSGMFVGPLHHATIEAVSDVPAAGSALGVL